MKVYEIGTGYTPIPAQMGAATEIVVEELVKSFRKQEVSVELLDIRTHQRMPNNLPITEVPVPRCFSGTDVKLGVFHKVKRVVYSISLAHTLSKILKNSTESVVLHFHNQYNLFFFLKMVNSNLRKRAKIVYTVHSYIWPGEWEEIKDTIQKRYFQEVFCVQNADCVLVLNDKTAEHFVKHLGVEAARIHRINNGVNTDQYHILDKEEVTAFKKGIGLLESQIILQVGSVCDRKNQLGAVKELTTLLQNNPSIAYVYAGGVIDEEYQSEILRYAKEHGIAAQVVYAGEVRPGKQLNLYYNSADVTVFPSKVESFGLVIIESISAGTPVVLAGKPLFALEEGWESYQSDIEFAQKVNAHLQNPHKSQMARNNVVERYSWDRIARDHLTIWNR